MVNPDERLGSGPLVNSPPNSHFFEFFCACFMYAFMYLLCNWSTPLSVLPLLVASGRPRLSWLVFEWTWLDWIQMDLIVAGTLERWPGGMVDRERFAEQPDHFEFLNIFIFKLSWTELGVAYCSLNSFYFLFFQVYFIQLSCGLLIVAMQQLQLLVKSI